MASVGEESMVVRSLTPSRILVRLRVAVLAAVLALCGLGLSADAALAACTSTVPVPRTPRDVHLRWFERDHHHRSVLERASAQSRFGWRSRLPGRY